MAPRTTHSTPTTPAQADEGSWQEQASALLQTARTLPPGPAVIAITDALAIIHGFDPFNDVESADETEA